MAQDILSILSKNIEDKKQFQGTTKVPSTPEDIQKGYEHNKEVQQTLRETLDLQRAARIDANTNVPKVENPTPRRTTTAELRKNFDYESRLKDATANHGNDTVVTLPGSSAPERSKSGRTLNEADLVANAGAGAVHGVTSLVKGAAYAPARMAASQAVSAQRDLDALHARGAATPNSAKATSVTHGSGNPVVSFAPVSEETLSTREAAKSAESVRSAEAVASAIDTIEKTTKLGAAVGRVESWADSVVAENQELDKPSRFLASAAHEIGRMVVQRGVTRAAGAASQALGLTEQVANLATAGSGLTVMYNQVYADNYDNAIAQGADAITAYKYGASQACLEVGTELLGGQPGLYDGLLDKGLSKLGNSMAKAGADALSLSQGLNLDQTTARAVAYGTGKLFSGVGQFMAASTTGGKIFNDVIGEMSEELISTALEPFITRATLNHGQGKVEYAQAEDYLESAVVSAIISLFYQGTSFAKASFDSSLSSRRTGLVYDSPVLTEDGGWQSRVNTEATMQKYEGLSYDEIKKLNLDKSTRRNPNIEGQLIKATLLGDAAESALSEYQANLDAAKTAQANVDPKSVEGESLGAYIQMMDTLVNGLGTTTDVNGMQVEVKLPPQFWPAERIPSWTPNMTAEEVANIQQQMIIPAAQEYGYYQMENAFKSDATLRNAVNRNFPQVEITPNLILDSAASDYAAKVELANSINKELGKSGITQESWDALLSGKVDGMELAIQSSINGTAIDFYGKNVSDALSNIAELRSTENTLGTIPLRDTKTGELTGYYDFNRFRTEIAGSLTDAEAAGVFSQLKAQTRAAEAQRIITDTASMLEGSGVTVKEMTADEMTAHPDSPSTFDTATGTLYLNPNTITNRSAAAISVSHELIHYFFSTGAGDQITNYVNDIMQKTGLKYSDWADRVKGLKEYAGKSDADIQEEVDARFMSIMMGSQDIINQFGKVAPEVAKEMADAVSSIAEAAVPQGESVAENVVAVEQKQIAAELRSAANGTLAQKETESAQQAGKEAKVTDTTITETTRTWSEWTPMNSPKSAYKGAQMRLDTLNDQLEIKIPPNSKAKKKAIRRGGQGSADAATIFYDGEVDAEGWVHYYSLNNAGVKVSGKELWTTYGGGAIDAATLTTVQETVAKKAEASAAEKRVVKADTVEKEKETNPIPAKDELENAIPSTPDGAPEKGAVEVADDSPIPSKADMAEKKLPEGFEKEGEREKKVKKPRVKNGRVTEEATITVENSKELAGYRVVYDRDNDELRLRFPSGVKSFSDELKTGVLPDLGFRPIKFMKEFEVIDEKTGEKKTVKRLVNSTTWHCTEDVRDVYKKLTGSELTQDMIDKAKPTSEWNTPKSMTAKENALLDELTEDMESSAGIPFPGMPNLSLHMAGNFTSHKGKTYGSIEARTTNGKAYTPAEIAFLKANGFTPVRRNYYDANGKLSKTRVFQHFMDSEILTAAKAGNADLFAITEQTKGRPTLAEYPFMGDAGVTWSFHEGEMILNPKHGTHLWTALTNTNFDPNSLGNYVKPYGNFFKLNDALGFKCLHAPFTPELAAYAGGITDVRTLLLNNRVAETSKLKQAENGWVDSAVNPDYVFRVMGRGDRRFVLAQDRDTGEYIRPKDGMSFEAQWKSAFGEDLVEPKYYDESSYVETAEVSLADFGYGSKGRSTFLIEREDGSTEIVKTGDLLGIGSGGLTSTAFWGAKDESVIPAQDWKKGSKSAKFETDLNAMRGDQKFFDDYVRDKSVRRIFSANGTELFNRNADYSMGKSAPGMILVQFEGINGVVAYPEILFNELVNGTFGRTDAVKITDSRGKTVFDRRKLDALNLTDGQLDRLFRNNSLTLQTPDGRHIYELSDFVDAKLLEDSADAYSREIESWIKPRENRQPNKMNTGVFNAEGIASGGERSTKTEIGKRIGSVMSALDNAETDYYDSLAANYEADEVSAEEQQAGTGAYKNEERDSAPQRLTDVNSYPDLKQVTCSYVYNADEIKLTAEKPLNDILESETLAMLGELGFTIDGNTARVKYNSEIWEHAFNLDPIGRNFAAMAQKAFDEQQEKVGGRSRIIPIKAGVTNLEAETYADIQAKDTLSKLGDIVMNPAPNRLRNRINISAPAYFTELQQRGVGAYVDYGTNEMRLVVYGSDNAKVDLTELLSPDTVSALRDLGFKFNETEAYAPYEEDVWKNYLMLPDVGGAKKETFTRSYNLNDPESLKAAGISTAEAAQMKDIFTPYTAPKQTSFEPAKATGKKAKQTEVLDDVFGPKSAFDKQMDAKMANVDKSLADYGQQRAEATVDETVYSDTLDSLGQSIPETVAKKLENSRATTPDGRPQKYVSAGKLVAENRKVVPLVGTVYVLTEATGEEVTGNAGYLNLTNPLRGGADRATTLFEGDYEDFLSTCEKVAAKYGGEEVDRAGMDMYYRGSLPRDSAEFLAKLDDRARAFLLESGQVQRRGAHTVLLDVLAQYADAAGLTDNGNSGAFVQDVITELGYDGVITDGTAYIYTPKRFISSGESKAFSFETDAVDAESLVKQYLQARGSAPSNATAQASTLEQTNEQVGRNSIARMALTPNQEAGARLRSITDFIRSDKSTFSDELKARTDAAIADGMGMYAPATNKAAQEYTRQKMEHGLIDSYMQWAGRLEDGSLFNIKTAKNDAAWTWALVDGFAKKYEEMSKAGASNEELAPYYEAFSTTSAVHAMMLTTAGQVEQSATMIQKLDAPSTVEFVRRWLEQKDKEFSKESRHYRKKGEHLALSDAQKQALIAAGLDVDARSKVLVDIANTAAKAAPRSMWKAMNAFRYTAMLCSPVTWVRNIGGNIVQGFNTRLKNDIAGVMEDVFMSKKDADSRERTVFKGVDKQGIADFVKNYVEQPAVIMLLRSGSGKYAKSIAKGVISSELDLAYDNAHTDMLLRHGPAAALESVTNKVLEGCDVVALKKNFKHAFRMNANAKGYTAAFLSDPANQSALDAVTAYAVKQAKDATFRGDTKFGAALTRLKVSNPICQIVLGGYVPFVNVPINVGKAAVKYSPISFAKALIEAGNVAVNGQDATKRINDVFDSIGSGLIGAGLWALGYALTKNGVFGLKLHTLDDDEDKDKYEQSLGVQHYSVVFRDGSSYTMDWLSPISMGIFAGAEAYNMASERAEATGEDIDDVTWMDYSVDLATRMLDPLMEMSFMSSITDAVEDWSYVNNGTDAISLVLGNYGNQLIPTALSKARTLFGDTQVRSTYAPTDSDFSTETLLKDLTGRDVDLGEFNKHWGASGERQYRQALNKMPTGLASHNANAYDYWGNPKQSADSTFERIAESLFSPGYYSSNKATALDEDILDLFEKTGSADALPSAPAKYFSSDGTRYVFTNEEYGEVSRVSGQKSKQALKEAYNSPLWSNLSEPQQLKITSDLEAYGMYVVEDDYMFRKGKKLNADSDASKAIEKVRAARATGLSTGEYYILKLLSSKENLTPVKDKKGGNHWKEPMIKLLRSYGLSDDQIKVVSGYDDLSY